jgi:hypothetical protein
MQAAANNRDGLTRRNTHNWAFWSGNDHFAGMALAYGVPCPGLFCGWVWASSLQHPDPPRQLVAHQPLLTMVLRLLLLLQL